MRSFNCFDFSNSVYIEMSPCFIKIFLKVWFKFSTMKSFVCCENFSCKSLCKGFVEPEFSCWFSSSIFFEGIVGENWSDENIITVLLKVLWNVSDVWAIVSFTRVSNCEIRSSELHVFFIGDWAFGIRRIRFVLLSELNLSISSLVLDWL